MGWLGHSALGLAACSGWSGGRAWKRHVPRGGRKARQGRDAWRALGEGWVGEEEGALISMGSAHEFSASESSELLITTTRSSASPGLLPVTWLLSGQKSSFPLVGLLGLRGPSRWGGETALEVLGLGCSGEFRALSSSTSDSILMTFLGASVWQDFLFCGVAVLELSSLHEGSLME